MKYVRMSIVVICLFLVCAPTAKAWNAVGHYLVAKIAYSQLTPAERQQVVDILKNHPHYKDYLSADRPAGLDENEWVFMRAAIWSDWIRAPRNFQGDPLAHPIHKFHRGPWHYVNYPYKKGQKDLTLGEHLPQPFNIEQQIPLSVEFARPNEKKDEGRAADVTDAENRAVRLCWVFHLVGDIHQPCHVTGWVDPVRLPLGDEGGNKTAIRVDIGAEPTKLHTWWDSMLGTDADPESVDEVARSLLADPLLTPAKLTNANSAKVSDWVQESFELAVKYAYLNDELPIVFWDDFKSNAVTINDVPILPVGAEKKARQVARKQAVVGGTRLAGKLREVLAP